jgi:hypothetical protein
MNETLTFRKLLEERETYLRGIGNAESEDETPCKNIREPVMRLKSSMRVSAQSFRTEGEGLPVCMLKT